MGRNFPFCSRVKLSRQWLWLLLLAPMALGIARLRFDVEILDLLPKRLDAAQGLKIYQQHFSDARELIITLEAPSAEQAEAAARSLAESLRAKSNLVTSVTWQPPWLENPREATELIAYLWLNQPPTVFGELTNRLAPANLTNVLNEAQARLATSLSPQDIAMGGYDPYGLLQLPESVSGAAPAFTRGDELFACREGKFRMIFVEARPDIAGYRACRAWLQQIRQVVQSARADGKLSSDITIHFTGRPGFVTEIAGGMENDMAGSATGTLATIGILFWLTHRRIRPLIWLLFLLLVILGITTAFAGLILGTINVVSMGFASILLGLSEDFGIVIYQESRSHPELNARELRREVAPGIFWSALTTAGGFLILNLSVLPGLGQLGSLIAIGIAVSAVMMLYAYMPPLLRLRRKRDLETGTHERFLLFNSRWLLPRPFIWCITCALLLGATAVLWTKGIGFDHSPNVLKPKHSEASAALEQIQQCFGGGSEEPAWVIVPGKSEAEVARRLEQVQATLQQAVSNRLIADFTLPTPLWPKPEYQQANKRAAVLLASESGLLREAALTAGFTTNSIFVSDNILQVWGRAGSTEKVFWPANHASQWILRKVVAHSGNDFLAIGLVRAGGNMEGLKTLAANWPAALRHEGVILAGWGLLGSTVFDVVVREMPRVMVPISLLVLVSLWFAFRSVREVLLSVAALAFSALLLAAIMDLLKWDWNILNLMALPMLLGMGVDFGIHIQLALQKHHGDLLAVRKSVGRALMLAGATTVAGFASLAFSTNTGMASLGKVCALGIVLALVTAVYLLPVWWNASRKPKSNSLGNDNPGMGREAV